MVVLSEYGVVPVTRPVHPNRVLRDAGLVAYRMELGREVIDLGGSEAFAMADHQVAHAYVRDPARIPQVRELLAATPGVGEVLDDEGKRAYGLDHPRSGELVLLAEPDAWFTYYYWNDDARAATTPARSTSTASLATTPSSCSSTRRSSTPSRRSPSGCCAASSGCAP